MTFIPLEIPDVIIIKPTMFGDDRGYFMESYRKNLFAENGIDVDFVQDNMSSSTRGVLRGLHYQLSPHAQGKLVRVFHGEVLDVAVDIRKNSPSYGKWIGQILSEENKISMYVPPGFAHGFCVISEKAEFYYKCTDFYSQEHERGIVWNDPEVGIDWPISDKEIVLSEKDANAPQLINAENNY